MVLKMKEIAEAYLVAPVTDAVISVPASAYLTASQPQATIDSDVGTIAGLNVLSSVHGPCAAGVAYGLDRRSEGECMLLVFDLWGRYF